MTIRASTIRNIGLNQPALPAPREIRAINRNTSVASAVSGRVDPTGELVGKSLSALGEFVRLVDERKDEIELIRFGTALEQQVAGLATQARQEAERPSDVPKRFLELHSQTTETLLDQVEDSDVRLDLQTRAERQRARQFSSLVRSVDTEQRQMLNNEINARIELKQQQAAEAGTEEARQSIIGEINALIDRKKEHNVITSTGEPLTDAEVTLQKREAAQEVEGAVIRAQILENPSIAAAQLQDPDSFPNMAKDRRLAFLEQAVNAEDANRRERIRMMERAEKLEDEAMEEIQQQNMVELQARISDPKEEDPTISEINALARSGGLTDTQQRIITTSLTSEGGTTTDPFTYVGFEERIYSGEVVPSSEIIAAKNEGLLDQSEMSRLLALNRSERDDRISSAKRQIKLQFGAGGLVVDFNRQQKEAGALQRFNRLLQNNPDADPFDLAEQSIKEVRLETEGGLSTQPPKPATLGQGEVTEKAIQEGMERLRNGMDNGTIGDNEAQTQMKLYQAWQDFLEAQRRLE